VLVLFFVAGFNHLRTNAVYGQDFLLHSTSTEEIIAHPDRWFPQDFTNRPLVYWIGACGHWIMPGDLAWKAAGAIFVVLNTLALWFVHDSTRRFLRSPALRVAAVAFVAFLPATQVATVVYAADAVCQLPFALAGWSLLRALEAESGRGRLGHAALAAVAFGLGDFARFTFVALLPAAALACGLAWRARRIGGRPALGIGLVALVGPALLAGWLQVRAQQQFADRPAHHTFDWHGTGEMTWSSLLFPKASDVSVLDAPVYWDSQIIDGNPRYVLLINNRYSYPALLHLGVFTDVLDYANEGEIDDGAIRPEPQKTLARWSVRLGLPFAAATLLAVLGFAGRSLVAIARPRVTPGNGLLVWGGMALAWYLPIMLALPFVRNSYDWGYWLPRLVIPALWGFGLVLFATLDARLLRRPRLAGAIAAVTGLQAALHLASVWY